MAEAGDEDTSKWVPLGDHIARRGEQFVRRELNEGRLPYRCRDAWGNLRSSNNLPGGFWVDCVINGVEHSAKRRERVISPNPATVSFIAPYLERMRAFEALRQSVFGQKPVVPVPSPPSREHVIPAIEIFCIEVLVPCTEEGPAAT
jgi:hypothetical protein